jgi:hypothetical protein
MIRWMSAAEGGRNHPPEGPTYSTVARFEDERDKWPREAWSLIVEPVKSFGQGGEAVLANVRFLVDEAPRELLRPGARFELCEGRRVVAKGVVLPRSVQVPAQLNEFALSLLG